MGNRWFSGRSPASDTPVDVQALATTLERWDVPGVDVSAALRQARVLLARPPDGADPVEMAHTAHLLGYQYFDLGNTLQSHHYFDLSHSWSNMVRGTTSMESLRHRIKVSEARLDLSQGNYMNALWCSPDVSAMDGLTYRERSLGWAVHARIMAELDRVNDALVAVGQADRFFGQAHDGQDVPPWVGPQDGVAEHQGSMGHVLAQLVLNGHKQYAPEALSRLNTAMYHSDAHARTQLFSGLMAARVAWVMGGREQAAELADEAVLVIYQGPWRRSLQGGRLLGLLIDEIGDDEYLRNTGLLHHLDLAAQRI